MPRAVADIAFRPATPADFACCARLYFSAMEPTIRALELDPEKHSASFRDSVGRIAAAIVAKIGRDREDLWCPIKKSRRGARDQPAPHRNLSGPWMTA
jgi:hypothetical protein